MLNLIKQSFYQVLTGLYGSCISSVNTYAFSTELMHFSYD